jgi:hypothetical protein
VTFLYLWVVSVNNEEERRDRLRRLERKWATGRARLGEELEDLGYFPDDETEAEQLRTDIERFRTTANELRAAGVGEVLPEREIARELDRNLRPRESAIL